MATLIKLSKIITRVFSTSVIQYHNPSLKKKSANVVSKSKKNKKPKKSNFGEAAYFKPSYHQIPYDPLLLDDIPSTELCDMSKKMSKELKNKLSMAKKIEEKEMNAYIKGRIEAREAAMKLLRCKYPHAYIRLIESIPKSRTDRKIKELDIIPGDPPIFNFPLEFKGPCESMPIEEGFQYPDECITSDFNDAIIKKHLKNI